uniref:Cilia- and flagella-associated protein 126 n=1 Tax=Glossina austeni TaxID=7395 RepID=A0A1A9VCM4_GLOAU
MHCLQGIRLSISSNQIQFYFICPLLRLGRPCFEFFTLTLTFYFKFEKAYTAKRLGNWELPKLYPPRPRANRGATKFVANDRGHLLDCAKIVKQNPWGNFRSTYELPDKLTREFAERYHECILARYKWRSFPQKTVVCSEGRTPSPNLDELYKRPKCPTKCETIEPLLSSDKAVLHPCEKKPEPLDLEYTPGDFTPYTQQHPSRQHLLDNKYRRDNGLEPELTLNKLYLAEPKPETFNISDVKLSSPLPQSRGFINSSLSPRINSQDLAICNDDFHDLLDKERKQKMPPARSITEKPNERCPSPVVPAYANFELAKRMHQDNLDHQPLPDCVTDAAFRKLQLDGSNLDLDLPPIATGVGVKTYKAGPTHCTKMKIYRPKTSGPKSRTYNADDNLRSFSATGGEKKKIGAMDLAICWDYKPTQEPLPARHIDGTNESAGPAVFTCVKTPSEGSPQNTGRSAGVFSNTLGEVGFFEKDLLRRKLDFSGRHLDPSANEDSQLTLCRPVSRYQGISRDDPVCIRRHGTPLNSYNKQYQSTPNILNDQEYKALREKYLGDECDILQAPKESSCKRNNFLTKARSRFCHKVGPTPACCSQHCEPPLRRIPCKASFRVGIPHYNAAGDILSSDSGCSSGSHHSQKVLVIPRPREPYAKRNYNIGTLVPPFKTFGGGAKEVGYPEHWRLASVYQHAYKPLEHRRRPLLHSVNIEELGTTLILESFDVFLRLKLHLILTTRVGFLALISVFDFHKFYFEQ